MPRVLVTCPPMLRQIHSFQERFAAIGWEVTAPDVVQTLSVEELCQIVPLHDGWIIGDDPATAEVMAAGKAGRLRAMVKWGIGIDNVDFAAAKSLDLFVINTPKMFGGEVADLALSYVLALARETFGVDRGIRAGTWPKPAGISLAGRTIGIIGLGDIGQSLARRVLACDMRVIAWDPGFNASPPDLDAVQLERWPKKLEEADFLAFTCALTSANRHMLNAETLATAKDGVRVINVARGPLIDERALLTALTAGKVHSAALDVFEVEPLPMESGLRAVDRCVFGSHNGSNTVDAVLRASDRAISILEEALRGG